MQEKNIYWGEDDGRQRGKKVQTVALIHVRQGREWQDRGKKNMMKKMRKNKRQKQLWKLDKEGSEMTEKKKTWKDEEKNKNKKDIQEMEWKVLGKITLWKRWSEVKRKKTRKSWKKGWEKKLWKVKKKEKKPQGAIMTVTQGREWKDGGKKRGWWKIQRKNENKPQGAIMKVRQKKYK